MREWEIGAVENIHGALPYIRFAPILALVGVGLNRIGKVGWTPTPSKSYEEAMNFFNLALEIDPKSSKMELAVLYQALGNIDLAVETAAEEARLRPSDTIVRSVLGWNDRVPARGVRALRSTRLPAGRAGTFRLPRWAA